MKMRMRRIRNPLELHLWLQEHFPAAEMRRFWYGRVFLKGGVSPKITPDQRVITAVTAYRLVGHGAFEMLPFKVGVIREGSTLKVEPVL
tara:strand:+ start:132 stop:398 length:267 start_codon:yes stop_codon:yes gene_type:complete